MVLTGQRLNPDFWVRVDRLYSLPWALRAGQK
jgi:hypothetical protein